MVNKSVCLTKFCHQVKIRDITAFPTEGLDVRILAQQFAQPLSNYELRKGDTFTSVFSLKAQDNRIWSSAGYVTVKWSRVRQALPLIASLNIYFAFLLSLQDYIVLLKAAWFEIEIILGQSEVGIFLHWETKVSIKKLQKKFLDEQLHEVLDPRQHDTTLTWLNSILFVCWPTISMWITGPLSIW